MKELCDKISIPDFKAKVTDISLINNSDADGIITIQTERDVPIDMWIKCTDQLSYGHHILRADIADQPIVNTKPGEMPWNGWTAIMRN